MLSIEKRIDKLTRRIEKTRNGGAWYRRTCKGIIVIVKEVFTNEGVPVKSSYQLLEELNARYNVVNRRYKRQGVQVS